MLTLERPGREFLRLPLLARFGVVALAVGGIGDVAAHLDAAAHVAHGHEHTAAELSAHMVAFVGMAVILLGVVADGVRRTRHGRSTAHAWEARDAVR